VFCVCGIGSGKTCGNFVFEEMQPMEPEDLEFYSSTELIRELTRRKTFLGVVIHADEDYKGSAWRGEKVFKVHFNSNMNSEETCRLLETITGHLERQN